MQRDTEAISKRTAVVIPAFNAGRHLKTVIDAVSQFIPRSRIIVVDDGSSDDTNDVANGAGVVVLAHPVNRGKGVALNTGIARAGEMDVDFVITLDADEQHRPEEIPLFLEKERETGADIIVGNRMANIKNMPGDRVFANRLTSWFVSVRAGTHVPDSQNGYRLIKTALYLDLKLKATRYAAESEILIRAGRAGARIEWVPVETIYGTEKSSVNPVLDTLRFLKMALRSIFW